MNSALIIEDLPLFLDEIQLQQILPPYHNYLAIKVKTPVDPSRNMASAHVVLDSFESAVLVAEHMENTLVLGRKIRVRLAINPSRGGQSSNGQINSIYVRFSVASIDRIINEADLVNVFSVYGVIEKVAIKEFSVDEKARRQYGYGFVHYPSNPEGVRSAIAAIASVDNQTLHGIYFNVEASRNLMKQFNDLRAGSGTPPIMGMGAGGGGIAGMGAGAGVGGGIASHSQSFYAAQAPPPPPPPSGYYSPSQSAHYFNHRGLTNAMGEMPYPAPPPSPSMPPPFPHPSFSSSRSYSHSPHAIPPLHPSFAGTKTFFPKSHNLHTLSSCSNNSTPHPSLSLDTTSNDSTISYSSMPAITLSNNLPHLATANSSMYKSAASSPQFTSLRAVSTDSTSSSNGNPMSGLNSLSNSGKHPELNMSAVTISRSDSGNIYSTQSSSLSSTSYIHPSLAAGTNEPISSTPNSANNATPTLLPNHNNNSNSHPSFPTYSMF